VNISDEAIEAAAKGLAAQKWPTAIGVWDSFGQSMKDDFRDQARAALEAAAPHLTAQALNEAADAFENLPVNKGAEISSGTWDWFELFPVQHIRDRAEAYRGPGAGA
jgi:hypothetical protein